jgi:hypothetical protein
MESRTRLMRVSIGLMKVLIGLEARLGRSESRNVPPNLFSSRFTESRFSLGLSALLIVLRFYPPSYSSVLVQRLGFRLGQPSLFPKRSGRLAVSTSASKYSRCRLVLRKKVGGVHVSKLRNPNPCKLDRRPVCQ